MDTIKIHTFVPHANDIIVAATTDITRRARKVCSDIVGIEGSLSGQIRETTFRRRDGFAPTLLRTQSTADVEHCKWRPYL